MSKTARATASEFGGVLYTLAELIAQDLSRRMEAFTDQTGIWETPEYRDELIIAIALGFDLILHRDLDNQSHGRSSEIRDSFKDHMLSKMLDEGASVDETNQIDSFIANRHAKYAALLTTDGSTISKEGVQRFAREVFLNVMGPVERNPAAELAIGIHFMGIMKQFVTIGSQYEVV